MGTFVGPSVGALVAHLLNQQIVSYTQYWPLVLGSILVLLLFVFPAPRRRGRTSGAGRGRRLAVLDVRNVARASTASRRWAA